MSTRSFIAIQDGNTITSIYCHHDGYVEHVGATLQAHYADDTKIRELLALGSLSILGRQIGDTHGFNDYNHPMRDAWCLAYGRDRGEADVDATTFGSIAKWLAAGRQSWAEFAYLRKDGVWYVYPGCGGRRQLLSIAVAHAEAREARRLAA